MRRKFGGSSSCHEGARPRKHRDGATVRDSTARGGRCFFLSEPAVRHTNGTERHRMGARVDEWSSFCHFLSLVFLVPPPSANPRPPLAPYPLHLALLGRILRPPRTLAHRARPAGHWSQKRKLLAQPPSDARTRGRRRELKACRAAKHMLR